MIAENRMDVHDENDAVVKAGTASRSPSSVLSASQIEANYGNALQLNDPPLSAAATADDVGVDNGHTTSSSIAIDENSENIHPGANGTNGRASDANATEVNANVVAKEDTRQKQQWDEENQSNQYQKQQQPQQPQQPQKQQLHIPDTSLSTLSKDDTALLSYRPSTSPTRLPTGETVQELQAKQRPSSAGCSTGDISYDTNHSLTLDDLEFGRHPTDISMESIGESPSVASENSLSLAIPSDRFEPRNLGPVIESLKIVEMNTSNKERQNNTLRVDHPTTNNRTTQLQSSKNHNSTSRHNRSSSSRPTRDKQKRKKTIRFSVESNTIHHFTKSPDEFENNPILYRKRPETPRDKLRDFITIYALPFIYGAATSINVLYFLIELSSQFRSSYHPYLAGCYLAVGYICRILFSSLTRWAPKVFTFLASLLSLTGFGLILLSQVYPDHEHKHLMFMIGSMLTFTNECSGALHMFGRHQFGPNVKTIGWAVTKQYFITKLAKLVAFAPAGYAYYFWHLGGLAVIGASLLCLQILLLIAYILLDNYREEFDGDGGLIWDKWDAFGDNGAPDSQKAEMKCTMHCSIRAAIGRRRMFMTAMSKLNRSLKRNYPSTIPEEMTRFVVPFCVFIKTTCTICLWGISAFIMKDDLQQNEWMIGAILSGVVLCNLLSSSLALKDKWHRSFIMNFPSPRNLYVILSGLTAATALMTVPYFPVFAIGFMIYGFCSGLLSNVLYEMQGNNMSAWEPIATQIIRRCLTIAALYSMPLLYHLQPRLPLVLIFWLAFMTSLILIFKIHCYRGPNTFEGVTMRKHDLTVKEARNKPSRKPEHNLIYEEQVMLARLIKSKDI